MNWPCCRKNGITVKKSAARMKLSIRWWSTKKLNRRRIWKRKNRNLLKILINFPHFCRFHQDHFWTKNIPKIENQNQKLEQNNFEDEQVIDKILWDMHNCINFREKIHEVDMDRSKKELMRKNPDLVKKRHIIPEEEWKTKSKNDFQIPKIGKIYLVKRLELNKLLQVIFVGDRKGKINRGVWMDQFIQKFSWIWIL